MLSNQPEAQLQLVIYRQRKRRPPNQWRGRKESGGDIRFVGRVQNNTLRPTQNGRRFADDIFKCFFLNENVSIAIEISLNLCS